jgi:hypothetical protein
LGSDVRVAIVEAYTTPPTFSSTTCVVAFICLGRKTHRVINNCRVWTHIVVDAPKGAISLE